MISLIIQLFFVMWLILLVLNVTFEFGRYVYTNKIPNVGMVKNFFNHLNYLFFSTLNLQKMKRLAIFALVLACLITTLIFLDKN